jgi:ABC-type Fe3+-siderophore transport system permease subunit
VVLPLLLGLLLLACVLSTAHGSVSISPATMIRMVLNQLGIGRFPITWTPQEEVILFGLRLPRVMGAGAVGAALAVAGVMFQGLLRNPLADPYVVGTSGGAALGAVAGMLVGAHISVLGFGIVPAGAFLGAVGALALVVQLASVGGRLPVVTMLLAGFAVSTLMGYTVSLLLFLNERLQIRLPQVYGWLLGGVAVTGWTELAVVGPLIVLTIVAGMAFARTLNAFSLGEDGAARLGIQVEREKRLLLGLGALLTACAVSISGLVGFVGLIVPHTLRLICGPDHRLLIPAAALAGACFMALADLIARTAAAPGELPVGIVTAFLGGPFFLWLLRRSRRDYAW